MKNRYFVASVAGGLIFLCIVLGLILSSDWRKYNTAESAYRATRYSTALILLESCSEKHQKLSYVQNLRSECLLGLASKAADRHNFISALEILARIPSEYQNYENVESLHTIYSEEFEQKQEAEEKRRSEQLLAAQRHKLENQSIAVLDSLRNAYFSIMKMKDQPPSRNILIQGEVEKQLAEGTRQFEELISTPFEVYGWSTFVTKITRNSRGETVVESALAWYKGPDGDMSAVSANFLVHNDACLQKVKKLSIPDWIKVYGRFTGKRDSNANLEEHGFYTLIFELDDVEE